MSSEKPAGPPVTGDGDAAVVREIAHKWRPGRSQRVRNFVIGAVREAYASGIARGRALGARDEQLACAEAVRAESLEEPNPDSEGDSAYGQAILDALAAIARRAGRGEC